MLRRKNESEYPPPTEYEAARHEEARQVAVARLEQMVACTEEEESDGE